MRNIVIALSLLLFLSLFGGGGVVECQAQTQQKRVVVLDAGHGNPRPGKVQKQVREADYVLDVAKQVRQILATRTESLDVYLTRSCDSSYHATQSVDNRMRAEFANKKGADLYVGIHANAHQKPTVNGCEVWVLTLNEKLMNQNDNVAARYADEGDFIDAKDLDRSSMGFMMALARQLENEPYSRYFAEECCKNMSSYGLKNLGVKAGPVFTVLYYFEGPGVIVELGYLTNESDYNYLTSKNAKKEMATAIADAIISYFKALDGNSAEVVADVAQEPQQEAQSEVKVLDEGYTIQLISSMHSVDVNDYQFKSYKGKVRELIGTGKYKYKYCYGTYSTSAEAHGALKEVRATFKDAYVVYFKGGDIVKK
ncbi:MAG: N-acetylmuramoyl-L-alanine amidase [Alistipes sp.]|nr:N-acetylmuramoyl-L-alanine amidase [Alistipes sp.]